MLRREQSGVRDADYRLGRHKEEMRMQKHHQTTKKKMLMPVHRKIDDCLSLLSHAFASDTSLTAFAAAVDVMLIQRRFLAILSDHLLFLPFLSVQMEKEAKLMERLHTVPMIC